VTEKAGGQNQCDGLGGGSEVDDNDDSRLKKETAIGSDRRGRGGGGGVDIAGGGRIMGRFSLPVCTGRCTGGVRMGGVEVSQRVTGECSMKMDCLSGRDGSAHSAVLH
jgi:hypothetical protein